MVIILVGNKSDLTTKLEVTETEAKDFARSKGLMYIQTSAKNGDNIDKSFEVMTRAIMDRIDAKKIDPTDEPGIKMGTVEYKKNEQLTKSTLQNKKPKKKNDCC